jgi:hypothetical protein
LEKIIRNLDALEALALRRNQDFLTAAVTILQPTHGIAVDEAAAMGIRPTAAGAPQKPVSVAGGHGFGLGPCAVIATQLDS